MCGVLYNSLGQKKNNSKMKTDAIHYISNYTVAHMAKGPRDYSKFITIYKIFTVSKAQTSVLPLVKTKCS